MSQEATGTDYRQAMTEREMLQGLVDACRLAGVPCYHTFDSRKSEPGFPDLIIALKPGTVIAFELKTQKGPVREEQAAWLSALHRCSIWSGVVRPTTSGTEEGVIDYHTAVELIARKGTREGYRNRFQR